ncbi:MAG: hypothetical protein M1483_08205 [Actinobacteria bacterium]|jgi:plastocyanin|nr:hypothetical protein [Actinomycetota bacterium]MCL6105590.1 hypothetical protein [Actinomycetota bacterium]
MRRSFVFIQLLIVVLAALLSACGAENAVPVSHLQGPPSILLHGHRAVEVIINYDSFEPSVTHIKAGQTVEWKLEGWPDACNVTFASFHSATVLSGTYFHTFNRKGTYHYSCTTEARMHGIVVVS